MRLGRMYDLTRHHRRGGTRRWRRSWRGRPRTRSTTSSSRRTSSARMTGRRCPTSTATRRPPCPRECEAGFYIGLHPNLTRYLTPGDPCTPASPGSWNAFTGESDGWQPVAFDLSAYAGRAGRDRRQLRDRPGDRGRRRHPRRRPARRPPVVSSRPRASRRTSAPGRCSGRPRAPADNALDWERAHELGHDHGRRRHRGHAAPRLRHRAAGEPGGTSRARRRRARADRGPRSP